MMTDATDDGTDDLIIADALDELAFIATVAGVERLADLGDVPPRGSDEWREWVQGHGVDPDELLGGRR
jgi:hypothetical protein